MKHVRDNTKEFAVKQKKNANQHLIRDI